jgi:hypothetical protein
LSFAMPSNFRARLVVIASAALAASACMTVQTYEGPRRPRSEVAHIAGDLALSAGAPISLLLRQVDGVTLNVSQNAVDVLPGAHTLLVDCRIRETGGVSRHSIEVEVYEGRTYRLVAETAPGLRGCSEVHLEAVE